MHGKTREEAIELVNENNASIQYDKVTRPSHTNTERENYGDRKEEDKIEVGGTFIYYKTPSLLNMPSLLNTPSS